MPLLFYCFIVLLFYYFIICVNCALSICIARTFLFVVAKLLLQKRTETMIKNGTEEIIENVQLKKRTIDSVESEYRHVNHNTCPNTCPNTDASQSWDDQQWAPGDQFHVVVRSGVYHLVGVVGFTWFWIMRNRKVQPS